MTEQEYNKAIGLRSSSLKAYISNPDKHAYELNNPSDKEPLHFKEGTATHMAYYEPERFKTNYHIYEGNTIASGEPDAKGRKVLQTEGITEYLTTVQVQKYNDIAQSLPKLPKDDIVVEQSYFKEIEGVPCKCRVDAVINGIGQDLKTTQNAQPNKFKWSIRDLNYMYQFAFYSLVSGIETWEILAVEKTPPYINHRYLITKEDLEPYINGSDTIQGLLGEYGLIKEYANWEANGMPKQGYGEPSKISELW